MQRKLIVRVAGEEFHCLAQGDAAAPLVLCLHGFPDTPHSFAPLAGALAAAGFHAVAPFLRGYAPSPLAGPYHPDQIADDVVGLADALSPGRPVALVGHDWGALATYLALARAPQRFTRGVTMAVPHPQAFLANLRRNPGQLRRSWYMLFFQLRGVAERAVARDDFALIERLWRDWSPHFQPPDTLMARLKACLAASMPAPIEYYRAIMWPPRAAARRARVQRTIVTPTLHLQGADDGCVHPSLGDGQERFFSGPFRAEVVPGVGHFLQLEDPATIAQHVLGWLRAP